jgi:hypothetical protein
MATLDDGRWHRLTVATLCGDDGCASRDAVYFIDGAEVARTAYSSTTSFYAIGNYQVPRIQDTPSVSKRVGVPRA